MWFIFWLVVAAIMIVAEIITLGLTSIWFAGGALVAAFMAYIGVHWGIQFVIFAAVSLILLFFTRPVAEKHIMKKQEKTNIESIIGQSAVVYEKICNDKSLGTIKINDIIWTARSLDGGDIEAGERVRIVEVRGVKLLVEKEEM